MSVGQLRAIGTVVTVLWLGVPEPAAGQAEAREETFAVLRERMVTEQIASGWHGIAVRDPLVLAAMRTVPRHAFILSGYEHLAYTDQPLPIAAGQTISQPFIVALMTELADLQPGERVLEIGTGSGYQAAVLASITDEVYSIEIIDALARSAEQILEELGYHVHVRAGDGYLGWPEAAPFDAILVTAAAPRVPEPLADQLAVGGRLVIPLGKAFQHLYVFHKTEDALVQEGIIPVRFVPMTGQVQESSVAE